MGIPHQPDSFSQSWLKDICVHMEDQRLTQREAIELVKDFTAECAQDEVEFYMGIMTEEDQSFEGLVDHLCDTFQSDENQSELISDFSGLSQKTRETEDTLLMTCRCWLGRSLCGNLLSGKRPINN